MGLAGILCNESTSSDGGNAWCVTYGTSVWTARMEFSLQFERYSVLRPGSSSVSYML
jgi:hypothetical protein